MSRRDGSRLVLMIAAIGILAPLDGGRPLAEIAGWAFGFYMFGILVILAARLFPWFVRDGDSEWWGSLKIGDITNIYLVNIVPWVFIAFGIAATAGRVIGLERGVWIK